VLDLAVVMPVYNEEDCIVTVIDSWLFVLAGLNIKFKILVLNDGSKDGTDKRLKVFSNNEQVVVINKNNSGHGPTILIGYKQAVQIASWVFQCDSDNEIDAKYFSCLWQKRESFDALFGIRKDRKQNISRKIISCFAHMTVSCLFGNRISDVNIPYRLMRAVILQQIIAHIPDDAFAPNVIISGMFSRSQTRIYEHDVICEGRKTGVVSIAKWKLWHSAFKSFWQILSCCKNNQQNTVNSG